MKPGFLFRSLSLSVCCVALTAGLSTSTSASAAERQKVSLDVYGAACPVCATALADALGQGDVQKAGFIADNDGVRPVRIPGEIAADADLAVIGERVKQADTLHRDLAPPALGVVLFAKFDKKSAQAALKALGELKGVDAKGTTANEKKGEISVKLAGLGKKEKDDASKKEPKLTLTRLQTLLKRAGVDATFQKPKKKS